MAGSHSEHKYLLNDLKPNTYESDLVEKSTVRTLHSTNEQNYSRLKRADVFKPLDTRESKAERPIPAQSGYHKAIENFESLILENNPKTKAKALADYINSHTEIASILSKRGKELNLIFANALYLLNFGERKDIGISFHLNKIASSITNRVYAIKDTTVLEKGYITYDNFLNTEIFSDSGEITTMKDFFETEGVLKFMKKGLPLEAAGAMYYDQTTGDIRITRVPSSEVFNTIRIRFDSDRSRVISSITNNKPGNLAGKKPFLEFHFHPGKDTRPSPADMRRMLNSRIPMLILDSNGRGAIWSVLDDMELAIRLKPYINTNDRLISYEQASKFIDRVVREGWIAREKVDLVPRVPRVSWQEAIENEKSIDSAA